MPKFEKHYVHFMWDNELQGKKCFVSSYIDLLEEFVTNNKTEQCHKIEKSDRPKHGFTFYAKGDYFAFAYYDPYYDLKVAHEQGKTIQYLVGEEWDDVPEPIWNDEPKRYRIKPDDPNRIVTNRELARWLAQGNGEYYLTDDSGWQTNCCVEWQYAPKNESKYVCDVMVRKWEDTEWHEPSREYMGL